MPTLSSSIVKHSVATMREVEEALARQVLYGGDLLTNLLEITSVSEDRLSSLLAHQHDLPAGPVGTLPRAPQQATRLLTSDVASRHCIYPLAESGGVLEICVASPLASDVESDLCFLLGVKLHQRVAPRARIVQAIARDYGVPLDRRSARILARLEGDSDPHPSDVPPAMDLPLNLADVPRPPSVPPIAYPPATELPSLPPGADLGQANPNDTSQAAAIQAAPAPREPASPTLADPEVYQAETTNVPEVALRQLLQQSAREADSFPAAESEQAEQQPEPLPSEPPAAQAQPEPLPSEPPAAQAQPEPPPSEPPAAQAQPEPLPSEPPAAQDAHSSQALPAEQPNAEQPNAEHAEQERGSDSDAPRSIAPDAGERLANLGRDVERWKTSGAKPSRRRGPYTAAMAEKDLLDADSRDQVLSAFFDFSVQYFDYAALFAVQGDLAEGRSAYGAGATGAEVRRVGVPLDLPGALRSAKLAGTPCVLHLNADGLDASLSVDLQRPAAGAKLLLPISVRKHCVLILYGCDGVADVQLDNVGPVLAFASLVNQALERLILRRKLAARRDLKRDLPSHLSELAEKRARARTEGHAEQPSPEARASALVSALNAPKRPSTLPAKPVAASAPPAQQAPAQQVPAQQPPAQQAPAQQAQQTPPQPEAQSHVSIAPSRTISVEPSPPPIAVGDALPETTASPPRQAAVSVHAAVAVGDALPETTASPPRQTASAQQPPSGADVAAKNDALPETTASPPRERPLPILAIEAAPTASASPAQPDADADDVSAEPRSEPIPLSKPRQSKPRPDHRSKTELLAGSQPAEASNAEPSPAGDAAAPAVLDAKALAQRADEVRAASKAKLKKKATPPQGTPSSVSQLNRARRAVMAPNSKRVPSAVEAVADGKLTGAGPAGGDPAPGKAALRSGTVAQFGSPGQESSVADAGARRSEPPVFPLTRRSGSRLPAATPSRDFVPEPEVEFSETDSDDYSEDITADSIPVGADEDGPEISVSAVDERVSYPDEDFLDEAPLAASSRRMSVAPRVPVVPHDSVEIHLPKVIVNESDTHDLVRDLMAGDEIAFETVVEDGKLALGALLSVFPGPIHTEPRRAGGDGPVRASECGPVLRALACIGQDAAGFVSVRTQDRDPVVRGWATRLLGELPCADSARAVARRVADADPEVRRAALTAGRLLQSDPGARAVLRDTLGVFAADAPRNEDVAHAAIEMLADLRDPRGVPTLIELLASPLTDIAKSAQWALVVLSRQDFGRQEARWEAWWKDNAPRHRIEWLIDSLDHDVPDLRRAAGDELKSITREYFGYYDDLPATERQKAQARYREWWEARGREQFGV